MQARIRASRTRYSMGKTDLAFFCRILAEAGLTFVFLDGALTVSDRLATHEARTPSIPWVEKPVPGRDFECLSEVHLAHEARPGAYTLRDHDLRRPGFPLFAVADKAPSPTDRWEQYHYAPGRFLAETGEDEGTPVADDQGAARHDRRSKDVGWRSGVWPPSALTGEGSRFAPARSICGQGGCSRWRDTRIRSCRMRSDSW